MIYLTKKFNATAGQDILRLSGMLDDIGLQFGDFYKAKLQNNETIQISFDLISDSDVQYRVNRKFGVNGANQDLIGGAAMSMNEADVAQIIAVGAATGTITIKI